MNKEEILKKCEILMDMYKSGLLGGEVMPEDENPKLSSESVENYLYFTLPMALNYQRNSYTLWEAANKTYQDETTNFVFSPKAVVESSYSSVQAALVKYKVALQKNKQTEIWIKLCETIVNHFDGDIRKLFWVNDYDVNKVREYVAKTHKKDFPYLSGTKIVNYWMYVLYQYTNIKYQNIGDLTVAPDTHVIKSTFMLGLITEEEKTASNVQEIVIQRWQELFSGTKYKPIDIHTPLWLWSRNGFIDLKGC